jgi:hypothetical protein
MELKANNGRPCGPADPDGLPYGFQVSVDRIYEVYNNKIKKPLLTSIDIDNIKCYTKYIG